MTNDELNLRAIKALNIVHNHSRGTYHVFGEWWYEDELRFHDSYDWAFLGLKFLKDKEMSIRIESNSLEIFDHEGYSQYQLNDLDTFPTPAQITQAWLEVLETK